MADSLKQGYRKLIVYQRMISLVILVYKLTKPYPKEEKYNIVSQMRRAVVSVVSNFVEGYLKKSPKEKDQYLERSMTSLHELDTQSEISFKLKFLTTPKYSSLVDKINEVAYLLHRYRLKVNA